MDKLTKEEIHWMELLVKSTTSMRELVLIGKTPERDALLTLINRAEALLWHLQKRDEKEPEWVTKMLAARETEAAAK